TPRSVESAGGPGFRPVVQSESDGPARFHGRPGCAARTWSCFRCAAETEMCRDEIRPAAERYNSPPRWLHGSAGMAARLQGILAADRTAKRPGAPRHGEWLRRRA